MVFLAVCRARKIQAFIQNLNIAQKFQIQDIYDNEFNLTELYQGCQVLVTEKGQTLFYERKNLGFYYINFYRLNKF